MGLSFFNARLATFLISFLPMIELKGAIPFGMSAEIWGGAALGESEAFLFAFLGSCAVVPILALIFLPMLEFLERFKIFRKIFEFFLGDVRKRKQQIEGRQEKKHGWRAMFEVFVFVAFPVALTGVWTGTALGALLGLKFWQTCVSVILGNLVCGLLVTFVCSLFPHAATIFGVVFALFVLVLLTRRLFRR